MLPLYAELQVGLTNRVRQVLELGVPDRRLATMPAQYEQLLADRPALRINQPGGLTQAEYQRLSDFRNHFATLCEQLAGYQIPASIHHGDFHDGNVFLNQGRYVFFDWGDSSVAHPFFSMRTVLVSVENTLQIAENAPEFERLRDAYLEPWTRYASREYLVVAYLLANCLSPISSALGWYCALSDLDAPLRNNYAEAVPSLLKEFLGNVSE